MIIYSICAVMLLFSFFASSLIFVYRSSGKRIDVGYILSIFCTPFLFNFNDFLFCCQIHLTYYDYSVIICL